MEKINVWDRFSIFYSASFSQKFLQHCYKNHHESDKLSYQNCYPFIYYLDHGKKYYEQASISPVELQPVLLFYGMVQLMKALLLTVDPLYPRTTQVLAHGVTTRKRKKNQYEFLMDEVKVQKNGLFTYFAERLFQLGQMEGEKIIMEDLLKGIPELRMLFSTLKNEKICYRLIKEDQFSYSVTKQILLDLHFDVHSFQHFLQKFMNIKDCQEKKDRLMIQFTNKFQLNHCSPILFEAETNHFYLPTKRSQYSNMPEIMIHYFLLYNLSMICRYETEWWGDLFHHYSTYDFPFIKNFLEVTSYKIPLLFSFILQHE